MANRGSEKLMAAWKARVLSDESVREIVAALETSKATVERVEVVGGASATGMTVALSYSGDDVPTCGNDIRFWLGWLVKHGGVVHPPRIIINGIPFPDLLRLEVAFGSVAQQSPGNTAGQIGNVAAQIGAGAFGG